MTAAEMEITPQDASAALAAGEAVLVDVRTQEEWDAGRVPGASHIAMSDLSARAAELPADRDVIFFCHSGARSLMAAQAFQASGVGARSLAGGAVAWCAAQLPFDGDVAH